MHVLGSGDELGLGLMNSDSRYKSNAHTKSRYESKFALSEIDLSARVGQNSIGIELKSLILAQIERWRHALHMQVERQHGCLHLVASGERVSKISERIREWGIT